MKLHRIGAFLLRHLYEIRTSMDRTVDIFLWPIIDLLTFGLLTVYIEELDLGGSLAVFILGGLILWTLLNAVQRHITFALLEDAWSRNLFNLYSTPLQLSEIIVGTLILSTVKALISVILVLFLAATLFNFQIFQFGFYAVFYLFNIFIFGWSFGYLTSFLIFCFGLRIQAVAWSLLALIYPISGVFYPLSVLPPALVYAGKLLPISYVFEGLRGIFTGIPPQASDLWVILGLNLFYLSLSIWLFVKGFKKAKERGWFIHTV